MLIHLYIVLIKCKICFTGNIYEHILRNDWYTDIDVDAYRRRCARTPGMKTISRAF